MSSIVTLSRTGNACGLLAGSRAACCSLLLGLQQQSVARLLLSLLATSSTSAGAQTEVSEQSVSKSGTLHVLQVQCTA